MKKQGRALQPHARVKRKIARGVTLAGRLLQLHTAQFGGHLRDDKDGRIAQGAIAEIDQKRVEPRGEALVVLCRQGLRQRGDLLQRRLQRRPVLLHVLNLRLTSRQPGQVGTQLRGDFRRFVQVRLRLGFPVVDDGRLATLTQDGDRHIEIMIHQFDVGRPALRSRICLEDGVNVLPGLQRVVQRRPDRAFTLEKVDGSQQKQPEKHAQNAPGGGGRYLQRNRNSETVPRGSEQTDGGRVFAGVDRNGARQRRARRSPPGQWDCSAPIPLTARRGPACHRRRAADRSRNAGG